MTDDDLAKALNMPLGYVEGLTPDRRALYVRMIEVGTEADLYAKGLGPKPEGALLDFQMPRTRPEKPE